MVFDPFLHIVIPGPLARLTAMCGRFANGLPPQAFYDTVDDLLVDEHLTAHENAFEYDPTYNVAPGTVYPVVRATDSKDGFSVALETMKWGLRHNAVLSSCLLYTL